MILKRENNFSDRVNDPVSKGKKSFTYVMTPKWPGSESAYVSYFNPTCVYDSSNLRVPYRFVENDQKKLWFFT